MRNLRKLEPHMYIRDAREIIEGLRSMMEDGELDPTLMGRIQEESCLLRDQAEALSEDARLQERA